MCLSSQRNNRAKMEMMEPFRFQKSSINNWKTIFSLKHEGLAVVAGGLAVVGRCVVSGTVDVGGAFVVAGLVLTGVCGVVVVRGAVVVVTFVVVGATEVVVVGGGIGVGGAKVVGGEGVGGRVGGGRVAGSPWHTVKVRVASCRMQVLLAMGRQFSMWDPMHLTIPRQLVLHFLEPTRTQATLK